MMLTLKKKKMRKTQQTIPLKNGALPELFYE